MSRCFFLVVVTLFFSCGIVKQVKNNDLKPYSTFQLLDSINQKTIKYQWFTAKLRGKLTMGDTKTPISASLRVKKDSALWLSFSALMGVEILRIKITPDSVKVINRLNETYWTGEFRNAQEKFGIPVSYNDVQNILVGQVKFPNSIRLKTKRINNSYQITSRDQQDLCQRAVFIDDQFIPLGHSLQDQKGRLLQAQYQENENNNLPWLPKEITLTISSTNQQRVFFKYSKVTIDTPKSIKFFIPESYEPMG